MSRGVTAEALAKEIHRHLLKHAARLPKFAMGSVVSVNGTVPPTLTVMFAGSATPVPGISYDESYSPSGGDPIVMLQGDHGDWYVVGTPAGS